MQLDEATELEIDRLSELGNTALDDDEDWEQAVQHWTAALALLPEPRTQWEASTWLNTSIGEAYRTGGRLEAAKNFLFDALNGPDGHQNPFVLMRLGQVLVNLGEVDRGIEHLLRAYMLDGEDVFAEDEDLLQLLSDRGLLD